MLGGFKNIFMTCSVFTVAQSSNGTKTKFFYFHLDS